MTGYVNIVAWPLALLMTGLAVYNGYRTIHVRRNREGYAYWALMFGRNVPVYRWVPPTIAAIVAWAWIARSVL